MLNYIKGLPNMLTRVTSGGKLIREIDGLRFLAIFPVVIQHLNERFERNTSLDLISDPNYQLISFIAGRGFVGVYIFFVISGFILALPFASHYLHNTRQIYLKNYYWRRVTRLEPPYILAMTSFFIILLFVKENTFSDLFPHFLASIFYLHNIIFGSFTPINPPAWTLEIEVQFYLMAPFLVMLVFQIKNKYVRRGLLSTIILLIIVAQNFLSILSTPTSLTILAHIQYFLIGFILADLFLCDWKDNPKQFKFLDIIGILSLPSLLFTWSWDYALANRIVFCMLLFILFYSVFRGYYINKFFRNKWIMAIGGMCYTIYLIHLPLAELTIKYTKHLIITEDYFLNLFIQLIIYLPILFIISVIFYLAIEKPCMDKNWPTKLYNRFRLR